MKLAAPLRLAPAVLATIALLAACAGGQLGTSAGESPAGPIDAPSPAGPASSAPSPAADTPAPPTQPSGAPLSVITSTTVLADLVRQVGGERVSVQPLMPAGRDPHTFEPSPGDAARLAAADLLLINGLGLDEWLEDLAVDAAPDLPLVVLGEDLDGVEYLAGNDHHHGDEGEHDDEQDEHSDDEHSDDEHPEDEHPEDHEHGFNPHLWLDVNNAQRYVERIAETLTLNDEAGRETYASNAQEYNATLDELDDEIRQQVGAVPQEDRRVVSFHDAFPYYAHAYGIEIVGVVVESPGQEPSAAEVAMLVEAIREAGVRAVLTEIQFDDRLADIVAQEAGVRVVSELYTDSLGEPPLDTYEATMRWNTERIVQGLR